MIAIALFFPAIALLLAWRAPTAWTARRLVGRVALALAGLWLVLLLIDPGASLGRFGVTPAAIGTWLLVASITWPARRLPIALGVLAAGVSVGGASLLAGRGDLSDAAGALAIATALVALAARSEDDRGLLPAIACILGAAAIAYGLSRLDAGTGALVEGGGLLVVVGAAVAVIGAGGRTRRTGVVLLPLALLLGIHSAGTLDGGRWVAVLLAVAGVLVARRPATALGCWAIAAAVVAPPAALLLAAAAVLSAALPHPVMPITALPGVAALAVAIARDGSPSGLVLAGLAVLTVARLWRADQSDVVSGRPSEPTLAVLLVGAWLLLAPETWRWVGRAEIAQWGTGVLIAAVAGGIGAFVLFSSTDEPFSPPDIEVADPAYAPGDATWAWRATIVSLAILGISGAALVASAAS